MHHSTLKMGKVNESPEQLKIPAAVLFETTTQLSPRHLHLQKCPNVTDSLGNYSTQVSTGSEKHVENRQQTLLTKKSLYAALFRIIFSINKLHI